jgi:hypothetical protein
MNKTEQMLNEGKATLDLLQAPPELENRLRTALIRTTTKKRKNKVRLSVNVLIACLVLFLVIGFNFETLAYYGKKLAGYDQVMNGTLQQLTNLGKGQLIGKSYTFKNGVQVTLDGVMLDDTQLLAFLTVKDTRGNVDDTDIGLSSLHLKGFYKHYMAESGQGVINEERNEEKWQYSFEPPHFYEKKLGFRFSLAQGGQVEEGEIVFELDRRQAVGQTLRIALNEVFNAHQEQIKLTNLLASPTQTVLEGSIQGPVDLAKDYLIGERIRPVTLEIKLLANGVQVSELGGGISTNLDGVTFHKNYDALPQNLKSLQIIIESFSADHDVQEKVFLEKGMSAKSIKINGQDIQITKVEEAGENTQVTITSLEEVILSKVKLNVDGQVTRLNKTINDDYEKTSEGRIYHTRTLVFSATGQKLELDIERMTYPEEYHYIIEVPIK